MDLHDILETYRIMNDWLKALWLLTPPAFVMGMTALMLHHLRARRVGVVRQREEIDSLDRPEEAELRLPHPMPEPMQIARKFPPLVPVPRDGEER